MSPVSRPVSAVLLTAVLLLAVALTACGGSEPPKAEAAPTQAPAPAQAAPALTPAPAATPAQAPAAFATPAAAAAPLGLAPLDVPDLQALIEQSKGKVLFVCLWSVHCPACLQELPELARLADGYSDDELHMVWASLDQDPQLVEHFFSKQRPDVDLRMGTDALARFTQAQYIPRLVVYDVNGKLVFQDSGFYPYGMLQALVQKALKG
ncbi:MAG: TlpA family protein disulfide reductase [Desulfovibrionaceae bacterium]